MVNVGQDAATTQGSLDLTASLSGSGGVSSGGGALSGGASSGGAMAMSGGAAPASQTDPTSPQAENINGASGSSQGNNLAPSGTDPSHPSAASDSEDSSDSSDSSASSSDGGGSLSLSDQDSSSSGSDSDSSSDSSSPEDSSEECQVVSHKRGSGKRRKRLSKKKKRKKKSKVYRISKKLMKKHLKKKKASEKESSTANKLLRSTLKQNPRWLNFKDVLKSLHGLKDASFWKDFEHIELAKLKFVPMEVLVDLLGVRADSLGIKLLRQDIRYFGLLLQKAVVHCDKDCSHVLRVFINLVHNGESFKSAYKQTEPYFRDYRTARTESKAAASPGKHAKGGQKIQKRCIAFNFYANGCTRHQCKFAHSCCFCFGSHSLRRCKHEKLPPFAVGGPIRHPPAAE